MSHQLAQLNIAYMRAAQDDPLLADFVARLDEINALADTSAFAFTFKQRYSPDGVLLAPVAARSQA